MLLNPLKFHAPKSLSEALSLCSSIKDFRILAGGTFLINSLKLQKRKELKTTENIISLRKIKELKGISFDKEVLTIKSMTTIDEIFESNLLKDEFEEIKTVSKNIATQQIRNMATIGGNLTCRYTWTEFPVIMTALDATMGFINSSGKNLTLSANDFYKTSAKADGLLTQVNLTKEKNALAIYKRVSKSQGVDIPMLSLAIKTNFSGKKFNNTRVSINNCVEFAQRDIKLENFLNNKELSSHIAEEALTNLSEEIYDKRASDYKKHMFRLTIKSAINELINKVK